MSETTDKQKGAKQNSGNYFDKVNYICLIAGIAIIGIGYLLMVGGGSKDPNVFNPEIFSGRRITAAPITLLIGFAVVVYAIMRRPKTEQNNPE